MHLFEQNTLSPIRGALFAITLLATAAAAQSVPVVTGDARVDKLLSQMTLQEKLTLIHGTQEDPKVYQGQAGYLAGMLVRRGRGCASKAPSFSQPTSARDSVR